MAYINFDSTTVDLSLALENWQTEKIDEWLPISLETLEKATSKEISTAVKKLLSALKITNTDNILTARCTGQDLGGYILNSVSNIYSFSIQNKDGLKLCFGEHSLSLTWDGEEKLLFTDFETTTYIKIGAKDYNPGTPASFTLICGGSVKDRDFFNVYPVLSDATTDYLTLCNSSDNDAFTSYFKALGGGSFSKLVDFVREYILPNGKADKSKFPIVLNVIGWDRQTHPEYGDSFLLELKDAPKAVTKDGNEMYPRFVSINKTFMAFKLLDSQSFTMADGKVIPSFAERAATALEHGGHVCLIISEPHKQKPLEWRPEHHLVIFESGKVPPQLQAALA
jgi:hypothetical protein